MESSRFVGHVAKRTLGVNAHAHSWADGTLLAISRMLAHQGKESMPCPPCEDNDLNS